MQDKIDMQTRREMNKMKLKELIYINTIDHLQMFHTGISFMEIQKRIDDVAHEAENAVFDKDPQATIDSPIILDMAHTFSIKVIKSIVEYSNTAALIGCILADFTTKDHPLKDDIKAYHLTIYTDEPDTIYLSADKTDGTNVNLSTSGTNTSSIHRPTVTDTPDPQQIKSTVVKEPETTPTYYLFPKNKTKPIEDKKEDNLV